VDVSTTVFSFDFVPSKQTELKHRAKGSSSGDTISMEVTQTKQVDESDKTSRKETSKEEIQKYDVANFSPATNTSIVATDPTSFGEIHAALATDEVPRLDGSNSVTEPLANDIRTKHVVEPSNDVEL
jgi:hypothetical protein